LQHAGPFTNTISNQMVMDTPQISMTYHPII